MQCFSHSIWFAGFLSRTLLDFRYFWNPARFWSLIQSIVLKLPVTADSVLLYLPTSYSDHTLSLSSGLYILPSVFCRLSLSATAASLANYLFWLCNTHWCCIIILDTSASRIYKKISGMEVVKWHRKKFMTRNLKFRL